MGRFKFRDLSEEDKLFITSVYSNKALPFEKRLTLLQEKYNIHRRTVSRWLRKLENRLTKAASKKVVPHQAKILLFDIETAPLRAYVWSIWNQNVGPKDQLISDWFMLTWSAKWLFSNNIISHRLTGEEVIQEDDSRIVQKLWSLLDDSDIVIGHNVKRFDLKRANTRFLKLNLPPPSPYQVVDTLVHCKRQFAITSNRLDYVGRFLKLGGKMDTGGFELWAEAMKGNDESLEKMRVYCDRDVKLLEDVYLKIRPYIRNHPNINLFIDDDISSCPTCGSQNLIWGGEYVTPTFTYDAFRCGRCGSLGRSRSSNLDKDKRNSIVVGTAR